MRGIFAHLRASVRRRSDGPGRRCYGSAHTALFPDCCRTDAVAQPPGVHL